MSYSKEVISECYQKKNEMLTCPFDPVKAKRKFYFLQQAAPKKKRRETGCNFPNFLKKFKI